MACNFPYYLVKYCLCVIKLVLIISNEFIGGTNMADYKTENICNIALIGHGSEGKTTRTEAMLFAAGHVDRQGRVEDGSATTDFDPEEI